MTGKELNKQNKSYPWDIVKSKIILVVSNLETGENEEGVPQFKVVGTKSITMNGKEFRTTLTEDFLDGIEHKVEIVTEKPSTFAVNQIFIRADGKMAWTFIEA